MRRQEAYRIRNVIETAMQTTQESAKANNSNLLHNGMPDMEVIPAGHCIKWENDVRKAIYDIVNIEANNPTNNPTAWDYVRYHGEVRDIPEEMYSYNMFMLNELGWWKNKIYKSLIDNNSWTPEQYPEGWEEYKSEE